MRSTPPPPIVDAGLTLRRVLLRAADALLPPFAAVWERSMGIARLHAMHALVEVGAIDRLGEGPLSARALASAVGCDEDALGRVLRVAELDGLVRRDHRRRYRLTRAGAALRSDRAASLAPWVRYQALASTREAWAALPQTVRTGVPGFRAAHGTTVWDHYAEHPDEERAFADAMRNLTEFDAADVAHLDRALIRFAPGATRRG